MTLQATFDRNMTGKSPVVFDSVASPSTSGAQSLGKDANNFSAPATVSIKNSRSIARLKLLDTARAILARHDVRSEITGNRHRTRNCHAVKAYNQEIFITLNSDYAASAAGVKGLQTCGSICSCPVCATKKMVDYGNKIRKCLIFAESENLRPVMLTLTARHDRDMSLKYFKDAFRDAYNQFQSHRQWLKLKKSLAIKHQITSREITYGKNGWHYHMHILFFVPVSSLKHARSDSVQGNQLQSIWMNALENNGLDAKSKISAHLSATNASDTYLAKVGFSVKDGDLAYELTGNQNKGRTVFDLLTMAHYGDMVSEALYVEYVKEMSGHKWITFSKGLNDLIQDIELEEEPEPKNMVKHRWMKIDDRDWYAIARLNKVSHVVRAAARWRDKDRLRCLIKQLSDEWYYSQHDV